MPARLGAEVDKGPEVVGLLAVRIGVADAVVGLGVVRAVVIPGVVVDVGVFGGVPVVGLVVVGRAVGVVLIVVAVIGPLRVVAAPGVPGDAVGFLGPEGLGLGAVVRLGVGDVEGLGATVPVDALAGTLAGTPVFVLVATPGVVRRTTPVVGFPGLAGVFFASPGLAGGLPVTAAASGASSGCPGEAGVFSVASWVSAVSGLAGSASSAWFPPELIGANSGGVSTSAIVDWSGAVEEQNARRR